MLFTRERINAATVLSSGLVSRVVPANELLTVARGMAEKIAGYVPLAVRALQDYHRSI